MKIKLFSKEECLAISVDEHKKVNLSADPWDLLFGLPEEVFTQEIHEVSHVSQAGNHYITSEGWAVPLFFVQEVLT